MSPYRFQDHTADLRIEIDALDLPGLFVEAGAALFDIMVGIGSIRVEEYREVRASGEDTQELFVDWLRELLYRFAGEGMVLSSFTIEEFSATEVRARCGGEPFSLDRHEVRCEIKAVTYHGLEITERDRTFYASVIFDI